MFPVIFSVVLCICNSVYSQNSTISLEDAIALTSKDLTDRSSFSNSYRESVYQGKLTPSCVSHYNRLYVSKVIPDRHYPYFHEDEAAKSRSQVNDTDLLLDWRIIGGFQVDIRQAPYAVLYGFYCGGALIAPEWVITAAHCKTEENFIIAGSTSQFDGVHYPICSHFLHPFWNKTDKLHYHDFDYQLLLLERPIPVTQFTKPIAIGDVNDIRAEEMVTISGWGHTAMNQRKMQNNIRQVSVPIIAHQVCQSLNHKYYKTITPRMFCAGYIDRGGKDSCQGDSGGPAVINNKLVGVVSFGVGCAEPGNPGVYTDIPLARAWIREITGLPL